MGKRILVAEDNEDILSLILMILRAAGYTCDGAPNGAEALELWTEEPYDMLVTDLNMPAISGFGLCTKVRELTPKVPILIITGMMHTTAVLEFIAEHGDIGLLDKPFTIKVLQLAVRAQLVGKGSTCSDLPPINFAKPCTGSKGLSG